MQSIHRKREVIQNQRKLNVQKDPLSLKIIQRQYLGNKEHRHQIK